MTHASRPQWRLFCLALLMALAVAPLKSQTPALTTISDTVFRANGSPASGVLLISWPAFSTAGGATAADLGFASKADLVGGLVPVGELRSGSANNAACLHGDSTWAGCGTGGGGSGLTPGMLAIKYATDFSWTQNPTADLSAAGAKTVTLTSCSPGIRVPNRETPSTSGPSYRAPRASHDAVVLRSPCTSRSFRTV